MLQQMTVASFGAFALTGTKVNAGTKQLTPEPVGQTSGMLVKGGLVVTGGKRFAGDVLIQGEKIVAVGQHLKAGFEIDRIIDATGLQVLPGGIDPHVHFKDEYLDDYITGSRAALAGGITSVGQMSFATDTESLLEMTQRYSAEVDSESIADVMLHSFVGIPPRVDQLAAIAAAGHTSIKIYTLMEDFNNNFSLYLSALEAARDLGILPMLHCEAQPLLQYAQQKLESSGQGSLRFYAESRPVLAEVLATQQVVALSELTGCPVYVVHLSSGRALEVCRDAQNRGLPVYVETRPIYLHYTQDQYQTPNGPLFTSMPPLRTKDDQEALWRGLANGSVHTIASDHAPWSRQRKMDPAQTFSDVRAGVNNLQVMLPMLYSEGVLKGKISLERFVEVTSSNSAKLFGLYPRKGSICPGADADLVLWDPGMSKPVRAKDGFSKADFSIYEGWQVNAWPKMTIRRGQVVYDTGTIHAQAGSGQTLKRNPGMAVPLPT